MARTSFTGDADANFAVAGAMFDELSRCGVTDVVISPGSRSAPLAVAAIRHPRLQCWSQIDERSGGFFGLGLAKASRTPVALICTSGTAGANYHPAVIEAHHARVPLLVLTADRPPELRDCGAGQTIDQVNLFGGSVRWFAEAPLPEPGAGALRFIRRLACRAVSRTRGRPPGPVHLDLPFREPLAPARIQPLDLESLALEIGRRRPTVLSEEPPTRPSPSQLDSLLERLQACERGVVVCGPMDAAREVVAALANLARALEWPLIADGASQLRTGPHVAGAPLVTSADLFLREPVTAQRLAPKTVLRFGDSPTSKALRLWLEAHPPEELIVVDPDRVWHEPSSLATDVLHVDPGALVQTLLRRLGGATFSRTPSPWLDGFLRADRTARRAAAATLERDPQLDEAGAIGELSEAIAEDALLYVSNSMPIRALDAFLPATPRLLRVLCNRGANGIDGMVSSALGAAAAAGPPVVLLTGDLAFLHDAGGLLAGTRHALQATIVILDNGGGGIFSFLPIAAHGQDVQFEEHFRTPHGVDLTAVARAYGARSVRISSWAHFRAAFKESQSREGIDVLVIPVDREQNVARHREIRAAVSEALRCGEPR